MRQSEDIPLLKSKSDSIDWKQEQSYYSGLRLPADSQKMPSYDSKNVNEQEQQPHRFVLNVRTWCLLWMVIQLTVWVRGAIVEQVKEAHLDASSHPEIKVSAAGEGLGSGDPCISLQSCKGILAVYERIMAVPFIARSISFLPSKAYN